MLTDLQTLGLVILLLSVSRLLMPVCWGSWSDPFRSRLVKRRLRRPGPSQAPSGCRSPSTGLTVQLTSSDCCHVVLTGTAQAIMFTAVSVPMQCPLVLLLDHSPVYRVTVPYVACIQLYPPEDEHVRLETCRGD